MNSLRLISSVFVLAAAFAGGACEGDNDDNGAVESPVGGWSSSASGIIACFAADHRFGSTDTSVVAYDDEQTWSDDGTLRVHVDEGVLGDATWTVSGDTLTIVATQDCEDDAPTCTIIFVRDDTVPCPD